MTDWHSNDEQITRSLPSTTVPSEKLIAEFEQACKAGRHPPIESFAARVPDRFRRELIQLLIKHDIFYRRERGEHWLRTDYQRRFPFLTNSFFHAIEEDKVGDEVPQTGPPSSNRTEPSVGDYALTLSSSPKPKDGETASTELFHAQDTSKETSGRYVVLRPHARGGLGKISVALDQELNREVALKELQAKHADHDAARTRFVLEAEVTGGLEHPGIVPVYGFGIYDSGRPFYAMQLIRGVSLKEAIRHLHSKKTRNSADWEFELRQLLRRFIDICNAIDYAHSRGVLHRDLKPSNVMLGKFGETLVVDWGLAKIMGQKDASSENDHPALKPSPGSSSVETMSGYAVGTPSYMSPEQAEGRLEEISFASDVYSLGATLYTMLTGKPAIRGKFGAILESVRTGNFRSPREVDRRVPAQLSAVCMKAMSLAPSDRYLRCSDLAKDIARWLAGEPVTVYRESPWTRAFRWVRRHRTLAASIATTVLMLFLLVGAWSWREQTRLGKLRAEGRRLLNEGTRLLSHGKLYRSELQLKIAIAGLKSEPSLAALKATTQDTLDETQRQIGELKANALARDNLTKFNRLRDDALFHGTVFTGTDLQSNLDRTQTAVREALELYGIDIESISPPTIAMSRYSTQEISDIQSGCYELVILYADTIARPFPNRTARERHQKAEEAIAILDRASVFGDHTQAAHLRRAAYFKLAGNEAAAAENRKMAEQTPAETAGDFFLVGLSHLNDGAFTVAPDFFAEALVLRPNHFWAQYFSAVCFLELDRPAEAIAHLTAANALRPSFVWTHILLGYARGRLENYDAADEDFRRALELGDGKYGIYVNRGAMQIARERLDDAITDLLIAVKIDAKQFQAYVNLGEAYRQKKQFDEALRYLDEAIRLSPWVAKAYWVRGLVYLERKNLDLALGDFRQALDNEPRGGKAVAQLHFKIARILQHKGRREEALVAYDAATNANAELAEAHRLKGELLVQIGRGEEAIASLTRSINLGGVDPVALRERAFEFERLGDHAAAIVDYSRALGLAPDSSKTRAQRGWALINEAAKLALDDFEKAIVLDPDNGDLYNGRGNARVLLGNYKEAVHDAEEALRLGLTNPALREKFALRYNAACIYSRSLWQLKMDTGVAQRESLVDEYQSRALELLREALTDLPSTARPIVVKEHLLTDAALDPLRELPEFQELVNTNHR